MNQLVVLVCWLVIQSVGRPVSQSVSQPHINCGIRMWCRYINRLFQKELQGKLQLSRRCFVHQKFDHNPAITQKLVLKKPKHVATKIRKTKYRPIVVFDGSYKQLIYVAIQLNCLSVFIYCYIFRLLEKPSSFN